jgi:gamma-glutamyl phosphate reductase
LEKEGVSGDVVQFIDTGDRTYLYELLKMTDSIDLVIPRGGEV